MLKIMFLHHCYIHCFKVKAKGRGQSQRSGSVSNLWLAEVNDWGSALPSAVKSNNFKGNC